MEVSNNEAKAQVSDLLFVRTISMTCNDCDKYNDDDNCKHDCSDAGNCKCEDNCNDCSDGGDCKCEDN